jgi:N-methylhydantoinase B
MLEMEREGRFYRSTTTSVDPITLEIVQGTVESARKEMELQIEHTARSIIIRERRDYRAGVFDRHGRNVSSASGAAHVDPILQNYPLDQVREGDVFIWNDPFKSAGGLTHLPDIAADGSLIVALGQRSHRSRYDVHALTES